MVTRGGVNLNIMQTRTRKWLPLGAAPLSLGLALLVPVRASWAAVEAVVTVVSAPQSVRVGENFAVTFAADTTGRPNNDNECQINNKHYNWTYTVTGSNGGVVNYPLAGQPPFTGSTVSQPHTANNNCQSYTVSATCAISYDTSPECGGNASAEGASDTPVTIQVMETACNP